MDRDPGSKHHQLQKYTLIYANFPMAVREAHDSILTVFEMTYNAKMNNALQIRKSKII